MLDLVANGSSWDEIIDLAVRIEDAGASIINTGILNLLKKTLSCICFKQKNKTKQKNNNHNSSIVIILI